MRPACVVPVPAALACAVLLAFPQPVRAAVPAPPPPARAALLFSAGGVLFAGYLTWLELFVIHAICRWCVSSAVIIVLVFLLQLLDHRRLARG